jgi:hypothetical protein
VNEVYICIQLPVVLMTCSDYIFIIKTCVPNFRMSKMIISCMDERMEMSAKGSNKILLNERGELRYRK